MDTLIIRSTQPPIGKDGLDDLEKELGLRLPSDYRTFLLEHNGGIPSPKRFSTRDGKIDSMVRCFVSGISDSDENLLSEIEGFEGQIPSNLIPIAIDPADNRILLSISGPDEGKIYYWAWDEEPDPPTCSYEYMRLIADNLQSFLSSLRD